MTAASQLSPVIRIVDDDDRVRESVAFVLQIDGHQTEEYESAEDFLKFSDFERPGCIVLDIRMPGMSGLELQLELKNRGSTIPILFLTGHGDMAAAVMALKRGAADFVAKPIEPEVLQSSVRNLVHWHCSLCRELDMRRKARERFNTLTPKEQEICRRIAAGALNKQTAIDLNISEQTVKYCWQRVSVPVHFLVFKRLVNPNNRMLSSLGREAQVSPQRLKQQGAAL